MKRSLRKKGPPHQKTAGPTSSPPATPKDDDDYEVAVVGADTCGLYVAMLLGSMGIKTLVLERHGEISKHLYHFHRQSETESHVHEEMAVDLQRIGLSDFLDKEAVPKSTYGVTKPGRKALQLKRNAPARTSSDDLLVSIPMKKEGPFGYPTSSLIHQGTLNEHLLKACQKNDLITLKFHHQVTDVVERATKENKDGGVELRVKLKDDETVFHAKYVVACDGAESLVREKVFFQQQQVPSRVVAPTPRRHEDSSDEEDEEARWLTFDVQDDFADLDYVTVDVKVLREAVWKERNYPECTGYVETAIEPACPVAYHVLPGSRMRFSSLISNTKENKSTSSSLMENLMGGGKPEARMVDESPTPSATGGGGNTSRAAVRDLLKKVANLRLDVDVALDRATSVKLFKRSRVLSTFVSPKRRVFLVGGSAWKMPPLLEQSLGMAYRAANSLGWKLKVMLDYEKNWKRRMLLTYDKTKLEKLLASQFDDEIVPHAVFLTKASIRQLNLIYSVDSSIFSAFRWENSILASYYKDFLKPKLENEIHFKASQWSDSPMAISSFGGWHRPSGATSEARRAGAQGTVFPQPFVLEPAGTNKRLYDLVPNGSFLVLGFDQAPKDRLNFASCLDSVFLNVRLEETFDDDDDVLQIKELPTGGVDSILTDWRTHFDWPDFVIVKPDKYVFAAVKATEYDAAINDLLQQLGFDHCVPQDRLRRGKKNSRRKNYADVFCGIDDHIESAFAFTLCGTAGGPGGAF